VKLRYRFLILLLVLITFIPAVAQHSGSHGARLYVANSRGNDVSVVDLTSFKVIGDIKLSDAERVHGVTAQPDGRRLFATVEGDHTLRIVDTRTEKVIGTIQLQGKPNQIAVTPDGKYVAVPIRDRESVDIVDVAQQKIVKVLPLKEPHNALNTGSNRYLYVSSMGGNAVNVIDLEKMDYADIIPVGGRPRPFVIAPDGNTMYVAQANLHGFVIVDMREKKVVQRVEIPSEHPTLRPLKFETQDTLTHGIGLTPDGSELWVSSLLDDCMYIYDLKSKKIAGKVATGVGPNWVAFSPDGKYICVSNTDTDDVSIIDWKSRREVARVKVGRVPKRLVAVSSPSAPKSDDPVGH
jgi:YVTN family beta-propeller protein